MTLETSIEDMEDLEEDMEDLEEDEQLGTDSEEEDSELSDSEVRRRLNVLQGVGIVLIKLFIH